LKEIGDRVRKVYDGPMVKEKLRAQEIIDFPGRKNYIGSIRSTSGAHLTPAR